MTAMTHLVLISTMCIQIVMSWNRQREIPKITLFKCLSLNCKSTIYTHFHAVSSCHRANLRVLFNLSVQYTNEWPPDFFVLVLGNMFGKWRGWQMEGKGPYRIYDPGGSDCKVKDEASSLSYRHLLEENVVLRERMKGLKSLGEGS